MNDTISREAAIDALGMEPLPYTEYEQGLHDKWTDAKENIEALPSAQAAIDKLIELLTIERDKAEAWRRDCVAFGSTQLRAATQAVLDFNKAICIAKGL